MRIAIKGSASPTELAAARRGGSRHSSRRRPHDEEGFTFRGLRVLVVDEPAHGATIADLLAAEGCDVRIARTAPEALAILASFPARLIVLDLVLPGMSGLLFARTLKAAPASRDLVIVALSAVNGPAVERVALEAGCAAWMKKPIDGSTFVHTLGRHLKGKS